MGQFYPGDSGQASMGDIAFYFIYACANGAVEGSQAYDSADNRDPKKVRQTLYSLISVMSYFSGNPAIGELSTAINSGKGTFKGFITAFIKIMESDVDPSTGQTITYNNLSDAADGGLKKALLNLATEIIPETERIYGNAYALKARKHINDLANLTNQLRTVICSILFTHNGAFNTEYNINNVATFAGNIKKIIMEHYTEIYLSWAKAGTATDPIPPSPSPSPKPKPEPKPEPTPEPEPESDNVVDIDTDAGTATVKDEVGQGNTTVPLFVIEEGPIYRVYDPVSGEHLFTKDKFEVEVLEKNGWICEGSFTVADATDADSIPVYRLYNIYGRYHFYTSDIVEATYLKSAGWCYEGISHYVYNKDSDKGEAQHRLYCPYSSSAQHIWTSDEEECRVLKGFGWIDEGICFKIVRYTE